jgi:hypothetical protein
MVKLPELFSHGVNVFDMLVVQPKKSVEFNSANNIQYKLDKPTGVIVCV